MATVNYKGKDTDFKDVFWPFCKEREGYRLSVYKDIKGKDTIGIGHLVTGKEPFTIVWGKTYTDAQIKQLFELDYQRLKIDQYVTEIQNAGYSYNMMLAVAHFIWGHGYGQYQKSRLRAGLLERTFTAESIHDYLQTNWDLKSPTNQRVNREDFTLGFSDVPATLPFYLSWKKR